ncbi:MAG: amidohydrolase/deacetylase family metallohydrolase [Actinomycetia bacterium]|nr:amidohydrolase/deacetylase family metallohydrolase [Actinomycetes bacterium]
MIYDALIKHGRVLDPSTGLDDVRDVAILAGRVAAVDASIPETSAYRVIDASGLLVTPGLIDLHTHVFHGFSYWGVDPDVLGPRSGVTTWVDAGSAGGLTMGAFREHVARPATVRIRSFINIAAAGLVGPDFELVRPELVDDELTCQVAHQNRDLVVGVKVRMGIPTAGDRGAQPMVNARTVADRCELPIMVHISDAPPSIDEVLGFLGEGDMITHCYSGGSMKVVDAEGKPRESTRRAMDRGVLLDVGHGAGGMAFASAEAMIAAGFGPHTISTDMHQMSIYGPGILTNDAAASAFIRVRAGTPPDFELPMCLSKFLAMGMDLSAVIAAATSAPARVLGEADRIGTLRPGAQADVAIFELEPGSFEFHDTFGGVRIGSHRLRNVRTLIAGREPARDVPFHPAPWVDFATAEPPQSIGEQS